MKEKIEIALNDHFWKEHRIGDCYSLIHANRKREDGWKIAYYPMFGTWKNRVDKLGNVLEEKWIDFEEPRALIERALEGGIDFREMPLRYLEKTKNIK